MTKRPRGPLAPARLAAITALFLSGTLVSACSTDEEEQEVYCVDSATHEVIDPDHCEGDGGGTSFFYWMSSPGYSRGHTIPEGSRTGYINPKDSSARSAAGLPATGKIGGTRVTTGGIGNGNGHGSGGG